MTRGVSGFGFPRQAIVIAILTGALALVAAQGWAQQGSIFGVVTDESQGVLPGVTVTVSGPALQVPEMAVVTDAKGEYRVAPLPIGLYSVEYTLSGFEKLRREGIRLTAGFEARLNASLKIGALAETVVVSGQSPVVDVKSTTAGTEVTSEILASVPTSRNGMNSLLTLGAGSRTSLDFGLLMGTDPVFAAFAQFNGAWITVDGVSTTSPFNGSSGLNNAFNYQGFAESKIQTIGGDANAPTSGMQLAIITKSGGNEFHGSALSADTSQGMQTDNVTPALTAQGIKAGTNYLNRWDVGGDLGGPIMHDTVWFYTAFRVRQEDPTVPGEFLGPLTYVGNEAFTSTTGAQSTNWSRQKMVNGKVSVQMSPSQRLIMSTQWVDRLRVQGPAIFNAPESGFYHDFKTILAGTEYQKVNDNRVLSLTVGGFFTPTPVAPSLTSVPAWTDQTTGYSGGLETKAGIKQDVRRWDMKGTMTWYKPDWFHGNHNLKAGAEDTIASGDFPTYDVGAAGNYQLIYRAGVPFEVSVNNNPTQPKSSLNYGAVYLQDGWSINQRLTLNLGLRYSIDSAYTQAECRTAAPAPFAGLFPAQCYAESHPLPTYQHVVPRLHAAYDLTGDGQTVLKGGFGRFYTLHGQDELNLFNPLANTTTIFKWHGPAGLEGTQSFIPGQANLDPNGSDFVSQTLQINNNLANLIGNPNLKQPGNDEYSASIERQLMTNFGVRVTGVLTKTFNAELIQNSLRPYSSYNVPVTSKDPGPDGKVGTADDPGTTLTYYEYPTSLAGAAFQVPQLINVDAANQSYKSIDITAQKRYSNNWQLLASFTATKKHIPYVTELSGSGGNGNQRGFFGTSDNPNALYNASDDTWEWTGKVSGSYNFPWDINVSLNYSSYSGTPWARTVTLTGGKTIPSVSLRVDPIGTERTPTQNLTTLRGEKKIRLHNGQSLVVGYDVINLFNSSFIVSSSQALGLVAQSGATYGYATSIANPRLGEVILRYAF